MPQVTTNLRRGTELAGYRVETLLGRGGMGVVYLAEQLRLKRRVGLKLLAPELAADGRFRERFLRESELAASLDHPNVIPVFDAGEADGLLYIAMRYVEGTDLGTLLNQEGRLEPERAVAIVGAIAGALDAAHARGLVHRDVKPANVLIAEDGHVYLADFGLTRSAQEGAPEEKPHLSGTLEYVAPEQIEGESPDPRADIYALGCVLYHCLAGQPPFAKRTQMELLWAHFNEDTPSLHQQRPELPDAIDPVIATALAKEPEGRYGSCQGLCEAAGEALGLRWLAKAREWDEQRRERSLLLRGSELNAAETYLDGVGAGADPALTALQREYVTASRDAINRRQRLLLTASLAVAAIAIVSLAFALISRSRATTEAQRADAAATQAKAAETAQLAQRLGAQALVEDDLDLSLLLARQAVAIDDSPQTRSDLLAALQRSPAAIGIMRGCCQEFGQGALSPDGRLLAAGSFSGSTVVDLFETKSGKPLRKEVTGPAKGTGAIQLPENGAFGASGLAFSPDGRSLVAVGASGGAAYLRFIDLATEKRQGSDRYMSAAETGRIAYSPDGLLLATTEGRESSPGGPAGDWLLVFRDPATGEQTGKPIDTGPGRLEFAFTPDGHSVLTSNEGAKARAALVLWDLVTRQQIRTFAGQGGAVAVGSDGRTAAIGRSDGTVGFVDLRSGGKREASGRHSAAVTSAAFSPDGTMLATTSDDGTTVLWDAESGALRETLRGHMASVQEAFFSPDGDTLYTVSYDGTAIAWDVDGSSRLGQQFAFTEPVDAAWRPGRISPDGRLIAVGLYHGGISLLSATDLATGTALEPTEGEVNMLDFSQDGARLAAITGDGNATIWDMESRSLLRGPWAMGPSDGGAHLSADGRTLAACGPDGVTLWNADTGALLGPVGDGQPVGDCGFDHTGKLIAIARDSNAPVNRGTVEIWDVARRKLLSSIDADYWGAYTVGFSPDDAMLATVGWESFVRLWNLQTGKLIWETDERGLGPLGVRQTVFSPDGRTLAVAGTAGKLILLDVATGAQLGELAGSITAKAGVALLVTTDFSPDGKHLLMTRGDGHGIVWDIDPASWQRRACGIAGRTLTEQEWEQFLPRRPYEPACAGARRDR